MPKKLSIEEMRAVAGSRGGWCLSEVYQNKETKLRWRCSLGHEWDARPGHVKNSESWCPHCSGRVPPTIEEVRAMALSKGGRCLSDLVETVSLTKLVWECSMGHRWEGTLQSVLGTRWCPACAGKSRTIEQMQEWAAYRGGRCLSPEYIPQAKLKWQCQEGHIWETVPASILGGFWCAQCAGTTKKTMHDMHELAASKGGFCLSKSYVNTHTKLTWQCAKGHTWQAAPLNVKKTSWCPKCKQNKRERQCRAAFESVYGVPFPKSRPPWLRNSRGNQMELDGYSEKLKVAFEYQGFQHYQQSMWHADEAALEWQKQRDQEKRLLCAERGIWLIEAPWTTKNLLEFVSAQAGARKAA